MLNIFYSTAICLLVLPKSSLPLSIFRKLRALITCGRRLPHCALRCPCPCFVCTLASWMMTCVTVLRDWKTRSLCLKWRRTESLTRGERKLSASLNFCNLNSREFTIDSTSNLFPLLSFNSKSLILLKFEERECQTQAIVLSQDLSKVWGDYRDHQKHPRDHRWVGSSQPVH